MQASYLRNKIEGTDDWCDSVYIVIKDWELKMLRPQLIMILNIIDNQLADIHGIGKLIVSIKALFLPSAEFTV